jgi:translation initiation factor IF-2
VLATWLKRDADSLERRLVGKCRTYPPPPSALGVSLTFTHAGVEMSKTMQAQVLSIFGDSQPKIREELTVLVKADVQGSSEAICNSLAQLKAEDDRAQVGQLTGS